MIRMEFKTEVLSAAEEKNIEKAAALLQKGELVALPTETVYGIAADARNGEAVKKVYERFLKTGCKDVKLKLYKDGRHEMLNELNKDEVYADVLEWLNSKI